MTPRTRDLLKRIDSWSEEEQQELAEAEIEVRRAGVCRLAEAVRRGLNDVEQSRFASEDDVAALLERARAARSSICQR